MDLNRIELDGSYYFLPDDTAQLYKGEPKLKTPDKGDWYVYYSIWDFSTGKWLAQKYYSTVLNTKDLLSNVKARRLNGSKVCSSVYKLLKQGINPKTGLALSPFEGRTAEDILAEAASDSSIPTCKNAIKEWINIKSGTVGDNTKVPENKENTANVYSSLFNSFLLYLEKENLASTRLDKLPKASIAKYFEARYNKGEIGNLTWNNQTAWLRAMFSYYAEKYDFKSPVKIERKETIEDSERFKPFSQDQLKAIFKDIDNPRIGKAFNNIDRKRPANILLSYATRMVYYTFIRISELCRLKIKNVRHYKDGYIDLTTSMTKTKKKIFNRLYIDPAYVEMLKKLEWEQYFDDRKYDNYYIFSRSMKPTPKKPNSSNLSFQFKRVLVRLKIYNGDSYSLYSFKATGNIDAFKAGWDLMQISIQNRHTTVKQTETYLRALKVDIADKPRPKRDAV